MDLELGQLELRYERLRTRNAERERRLLAAIADVGQQLPIVVVGDAGRWVVVDGYKRVRALRRLGHDTVRATAWELGEAEALLLERLLRAGEMGSALEQGWLLKELSSRFGLGREELARRFDRTVSWVSRRLALVNELPTSVQEHVRAGAIGAHAAMKYLVPLARANEADCARLSDAIAPERFTSRQVAELYAAYSSAGTSGRELLMKQPAVVLRARSEDAEAVAKRQPRRRRARRARASDPRVQRRGVRGGEFEAVLRKGAWQCWMKAREVRSSGSRRRGTERGRSHGFYPSREAR